MQNVFKTTLKAAWRVVMPVVEAWQRVPPGDFPNYPGGTWGPEALQGLLSPGHRWPTPVDLKARPS